MANVITILEADFKKFLATIEAEFDKLTGHPDPVVAAAKTTISDAATTLVAAATTVPVVNVSPAVAGVVAEAAKTPAA